MTRKLSLLAAATLMLLIMFSLYRCTDNHQKVIRIWQTESDPNAKLAFERIIKKFEAKHPGTVIKYEAINWDALADKLTAALSTGDVPDIVHLEPFMVKSLQQKQLLEPIDEVINAIGANDIYPSVKDLQYFDGHYYGIAYAIGTTYYSYRKDWAQGIQEPKTWKEYLEFVAKLQHQTDSTGKRFGVDLPGGSPFFMEQLFGELVASNGGGLFSETGRPTFQEPQVLEALEFVSELVKTAPPDWVNETYQDQFKTLASGKVASVPVTYGRAFKQIEKDAARGTNNPDHFAVMEQPIGPHGTVGYSTIDCEPWCILASSKVKAEAKEFLTFFYQNDNYLDFCLQVPIHLTPIKPSLAESQQYLNDSSVKKWSAWQQLSIKMIKEQRANPIYLVKKEDRNLPFLMELQGSRIITEMMVAVANEGKTPAQAAQVAQQKAESLIESLGYKKW